MATPKHCLVPTEEINDFIQKNYPDKSHYLVLCQIALWQEAHADNWDQLPSKEELDAYVKMLRGKHSEIRTPLKQEFRDSFRQTVEDYSSRLNYMAAEGVIEELFDAI